MELIAIALSLLTLCAFAVAFGSDSRIRNEDHPQPWWPGRRAEEI